MATKRLRSFWKQSSAWQNGMKLPVVAEGVETRKEWNYLKSMECEMVQGYYFYKPIPQADFCEVLDQEVLQKYAVQERNLFELDDTIFDIFNHSNSKENMLFYDMIGGMGVMEMTDDSLEILQVNRGYYEVFYRTEAHLTEITPVLHKKLSEPTLSPVLASCHKAKDSNQFNRFQLLDAGCQFCMGKFKTTLHRSPGAAFPLHILR